MRQRRKRHPPCVHRRAFRHADALLRRLGQSGRGLGFGALHPESESRLREEFDRSGRALRRGIPMKQDGEHKSEISRYEFSGIEERHGIIPKWLTAVYAGMFLWKGDYQIDFCTGQV